MSFPFSQMLWKLYFLSNTLGHFYTRQMSPFDGAPEEFDQTIFIVNKDRSIGQVEALALNLVKEQQRYKLWLIGPNLV